jgi:hypothetical protein
MTITDEPPAKKTQRLIKEIREQEKTATLTPVEPMTDIAKDIYETFMSNAIPADEASGPGKVVSVDVAMKLTSVFIQRGIVKASAGFARSQLLGVATPIMANLIEDYHVSNEDLDGAAERALSAAKILIEAAIKYSDG